MVPGSIFPKTIEKWLEMMRSMILSLASTNKKHNFSSSYMSKDGLNSISFTHIIEISKTG